MISDRDLVGLHLKGSPYQPAAMTRERGEKWMRETASGQSGKWELVHVPTCRCCGEIAWPNQRCTKHQERNPCVVEGCRRTAGVPRSGELSDGMAICGHHWRAFVPPNSPMRRAYNRFWRLAKKQGGWDEALIRRFERFWDALVRRVRRAATEGQMDEAEIRKMFGWEDE